MNKSIFLILGLLSYSAHATNVTPFKTIEEAEKYCPQASEISYDKDPKSTAVQGKFTAQHNEVNFAQKSESTLADPLSNPQFLQINGMYGIAADNLIHCFYSYTSVGEINTMLVMENNAQPADASDLKIQDAPILQSFVNKTDKTVELTITNDWMLRGKITLAPHKTQVNAGMNIISVTVESIK